MLDLKEFEKGSDTPASPTTADRQDTFSHGPDDVAEYDLCGVIVHKGSVRCGHYYAYMRDYDHEKGEWGSWLEFDDEHVTVYPDGARIAYNHTTGALTATGIQTGTIEAQVKVTIDTPETHITGKLTVDDLLTYGNGLAGNGGANNNFITGDFTHITGDLSSNGVVLHTHTHPGDSGGTTGAPT